MERIEGRIWGDIRGGHLPDVFCIAWRYMIEMRDRERKREIVTVEINALQRLSIFIFLYLVTTLVNSPRRFQ